MSSFVVFCKSAKDFLLDVDVLEAGLTQKRGGVCFYCFLEFCYFFNVNVDVCYFFFGLNNKNIECSAQNPPTNQRWPFPTVLNFCCFLQSTSKKLQKQMWAGVYGLKQRFYRNIRIFFYTIYTLLPIKAKTVNGLQIYTVKINICAVY